jgi:hypothetical protein
MRAIGSKLTLLLVSLALSFLFVEACFRILDYRGFHSDRVRDWQHALIPEQDESRIPRINIQFKPNSRFRLVYDSNPAGYFDQDNSLTIQLNNHGHRGPDFEVPKPPGIYRVLVLGDSFTLGEGVRLEHTFVHRLQDLVRDRVSATIEVLNIGVSAWSTNTETIYLEKRALGFEPDLVVLVFVPNDANYAAKLDLFEDYRDRYEAPSFLRHSYVASFVYMTVNREIAGRKYIENKAIAAVSLKSAKYKWKKTLGELVRAKRLAAANGSRFAVVMFPFMYRLSDDYPLWRLHALVENACRENQIPYVDLPESFKGQDYIDLWVHPSDQHPNQHAHEIAARAIADFLIEEGLLLPRSVMSPFGPG